MNPCPSCAERGRLIGEMREAYRRRDYAEVRRIMKEAFGTFKTDWDKLTTFTIVTRDGGKERFDLNDSTNG